MFNKIFKLFLELKTLYINNFDTSNMYNREEYGSAVEKWADKVSFINPYFKNVLNNVQINQYGYLCLFKYKSYNVLFNEMNPSELWTAYDGIYRDCRGVTIDVKNDVLVCNGFNKFFNVNELEETSVDVIAEKIVNAKMVEVTDKLDGSLQMARYYNNGVVLTGSTGLDPEESYRVKNGTNFILNNYNYFSMLKENPNICFIFEYIMEDDPHVVMYDYSKIGGLHLLGWRDMNTGYLASYAETFEMAEKFNVMTTSAENYTFDELLKVRDNFHCADKEGWVINIDGYRVKLKCTEFTELHGVISGVRFNSDRLGNTLLRALQNDNIDDIMAGMTERYKNEAEKTLNTIRKYIDIHEGILDKYLEEGKDYMSTPLEFVIWANKNIPAPWAARTINKFKGTNNKWLRGQRFYQIREFVENHEKENNINA